MSSYMTKKQHIKQLLHFIDSLISDEISMSFEFSKREILPVICHTLLRQQEVLSFKSGGKIEPLDKGNTST